jgi:hypothetical protein
MSFRRWQKLIANSTVKVVTCSELSAKAVERACVNFESAFGLFWSAGKIAPSRRETTFSYW